METQELTRILLTFVENCYIFKTMKTEIISMRVNSAVMDTVRKQAKAENRPISRQIETMIIRGSSFFDAKQPFILAVFPQGANEQDIDKVLKSVNNLQIGTGPG